MEIRNEIKMDKKAAEKTVIHPKSMADLQRIKVERLMRKPDKPVFIPEKKKEWKPRQAPEFVRDVMGSSAGAGSGEFHVYRHIRRREFAREEYLNKVDKKQKLDEEFLIKREENTKKAEEATARKRAKRQRKKQKAQMKKKQMAKEKKSADGEEKSSSEDSEESDENKKEDDAEEQSFVMGGR